MAGNEIVEFDNILDELRWTKRVTEDDDTDFYGRIISEIERLQAEVERLREAASDAFGTLHYIYETTGDDHEKRAAKEARDKLDAALTATDEKEG